ncbi:MAG: hypothetical protein HZB26_14220 [Candidatus Hydrogenedentes bacterium]|nr:hypothetical protein [Candidatus Hydrogenedentota bacterium]
MTHVQDASDLAKQSALDSHTRLEAAISAWKASVSDAHASLTSRLLQTHELLDCLVRAFAERQDRSNGAFASLAQVDELRAALSVREQELAAAAALTTDQAQRIGDLESELHALRQREAEAQSLVFTKETEDRLKSGLRAEAVSESVEHADELERMRLELSALRHELESVRETQESERRAGASALEQQAQWKNELAQKLAVESRARQLLEDECEDLRADNLMLRRANESLSREATASRPGGKTTYPFRIYDESGRKRKLGEMLVDAGYLTSTQLDHALVEQESIRDTKLGAILVNKGLVAEDVVAEGVALQQAS